MFYVILTVFKSYQDDGRLTVEKISPCAGLELGTARSVG